MTGVASLRRWLDGRHPRWTLLAEWADASRGARRDFSDLTRLARAYAGLTADVGLARGALGADAELTRRLESLLAATTNLIYRQPTRWREQCASLFGPGIRARMHALRGRLAAVVAIFVCAAVCGWWLVDRYPELTGLIASEEMIESVQSGELWTAGMLAVVPPAFVALGIMTNNIVVALFAFTLGAFYGIGTLYILVMNGFMLGGAFAFTARYGLADELLRFVLAHGVVELSVVCVAAAAGVSLGEALARPGNRSRASAFQQAVSDAGQVLAVSLPFLIGAGLIEGFISPDDRYSMLSRAVIGVAYEFLLVVMLTSAWQRVRTA